jgi:hypothetical protein
MGPIDQGLFLSAISYRRVPGTVDHFCDTMVWYVCQKRSQVLSVQGEEWSREQKVNNQAL